ncbi:MAG: efflux RND transporter permease subunit [Pseudomonadota bacterium]
MPSETALQGPKGPRASIATLYLRNRHLLGLTILVLLIGGFASSTNLPRLEDPRITTRGATILTFLPGASPARIEALINEKIEDTLEEIDEIKTIKSTAKRNVSSINIELLDSVTRDNNEDIFSKIRSRLQNVSGELPPEASTPILDDNRGVTAYTLIFGLSWNGEGPAPMNLLNRLALGLKDQMLGVADTELVRIFGGVEEEVAVIPDPNELAALNISALELAQIIRTADSKTAAGQIRSSSNDLQIEVDGEIDSIDRINRIPVLIGEQGTALTVGDIADVSRSYRNPPEQIGLNEGQRTIFIGARANADVRIDRWTENALLAFDEFDAELSDQIGIDLIFNQNEYTSERLRDLLLNLFLGALVVVSIVLFTMGWKSALVVGSVLPLSAAGSLFAFNFFDQDIHQMSIFGLIIAIGLLIDSAIVMTDEVRKSMRSKGMNRLQAMEHSVKHLFAPLLASTFTTILGFMPIFLLPGNAGDFVGPIAISVILALVFSFFLAMTVIPALAANASEPRSNAKGKQAPRTTSWWRNGLKKPVVFEHFKQFTLHAIRAPKRFILLAIIPSLLGFALIGTMKVEFFPAADRDMFEIHVYLPSNSAIAHAATIADRADAVIRDIDGVVDTHWLVGASTPTVYYNSIPTQDNNSAYAQAIVTAVDNTTADRIMPLIHNALSEAIPDAKAVVKKFAQGPPVEAPVEFRILGPDIDTLRALGEQVREIMHRSPDIVHSRASIEGGQPKLWFEADETQANMAGLDLVSIANQFQGNLEGFAGGSLLEDVEELPVRVRFDDRSRSEISEAGNLQLASQGIGQSIPAEALGNLSLRPETPEISRYNGQRSNNIFAYVRPSAKAVSVSSEVLAGIESEITVPPGYSIAVAGDSEQQAQAIGGLAIFAPVLLTLMAATLILTFRSVALAGIVFTVALLSVGLGMLALKIAGYPLGFNPLIGSIGLAGVAINGTIVVLAAILSNEQAKAGDLFAIVEETYGCGRHMISTTLTTIGGFVPLLLFSGGSFWPPLAVVIAGGMGFSLILTMFFTPLAYRAYVEVLGARSRSGRQSLLAGVAS